MCTLVNIGFLAGQKGRHPLGWGVASIFSGGFSPIVYLVLALALPDLREVEVEVIRRHRPKGPKPLALFVSVVGANPTQEALQALADAGELPAGGRLHVEMVSAVRSQEQMIARAIESAEQDCAIEYEFFEFEDRRAIVDRSNVKVLEYDQLDYVIVPVFKPPAKNVKPPAKIGSLRPSGGMLSDQSLVDGGMGVVTCPKCGERFTATGDPVIRQLAAQYSGLPPEQREECFRTLGIRPEEAEQKCPKCSHRF